MGLGLPLTVIATAICLEDKDAEKVVRFYRDKPVPRIGRGKRREGAALATH